jgi:hypothetical protein
MSVRPKKNAGCVKSEFQLQISLKKTKKQWQAVEAIAGDTKPGDQPNKV